MTRKGWDPVTLISGNGGEAAERNGGPSTFLQVTHVFSSFFISCRPLGSTIVEAELKCRVHRRVKLSRVCL